MYTSYFLIQLRTLNHMAIYYFFAHVVLTLPDFTNPPRASQHTGPPQSISTFHGWPLPPSLLPMSPSLPLFSLSFFLLPSGAQLIATFVVLCSFIYQAGLNIMIRFSNILCLQRSCDFDIGHILTYYVTAHIVPETGRSPFQTVLCSQPMMDHRLD